MQTGLPGYTTRSRESVAFPRSIELREYFPAPYDNATWKGFVIRARIAFTTIKISSSVLSRSMALVQFVAGTHRTCLGRNDVGDPGSSIYKTFASIGPSSCEPLGFKRKPRSNEKGNIEIVRKTINNLLVPFPASPLSGQFSSGCAWNCRVSKHWENFSIIHTYGTKNYRRGQK